VVTRNQPERESPVPTHEPDFGALDEALDRVRARARATARMPSPGRCRAIRVRAGLTQLALARVVGVSIGAIKHWESGRNHPREPLLTAYLTVLDRLVAGAAIGPAIDAGTEDVTQDVTQDVTRDVTRDGRAESS
jgi:DNA-binding transcriptional regulator YiaG